MLEKVSNNDGEVGIKSKAIISQIRMGLYTKIAEENAEAEAVTVSDEDIERMKQRAFSPGKVLRAIASPNSPFAQISDLFKIIIAEILTA